MGRSPRVPGVGASYHLMARGSGHQRIFLRPADRYMFLEFLDCVSRTHQWATHAWCLMSNHVHLLLTTTHPDLSAGMGELLGQYSRRFGLLHGRSGHLFGDRFRSIVVESDRQMLATVRYIARNPVRAGLASHPAGYWWSSYSERAREGRLLATFDDARVLGSLHPRREIAQAQLRELVEVDTAPSRIVDPRPTLTTVFDAVGRRQVVHAAVGLGYTPFEIAGVLGVTPRTVRKQMKGRQAA